MSGKIEGINKRLKLVKRTVYGFHSKDPEYSGRPVPTSS